MFLKICLHLAYISIEIARKKFSFKRAKSLGITKFFRVLDNER